MDDPYAVEAVRRAAAIAALFDETNRSLAPKELAGRSGIPLRTLSRLIDTMVGRDLLVRARDGSVRLGPQWLRLARTQAETVNIRDVAARVMRRLRAELDETYILGLRHGDSRLIAECLLSTQPIRRMSHVGFETPIHVGSGGRSIMSRMSDEEIAAYLARARLENVGYDTMTDVARIRDDIAKARRDGYLTSRAEITQESFSCSAPIVDVAGRVVASFTITLPLVRLTPDLETSAVSAVLAGAADISKALGHGRAR